MAIAGFPFWLSAAHTVAKTSGYISGAFNSLGVPIPRWCSELIGKTLNTTVNLPGGELRSLDINSGYVTWETGRFYTINIPSNALYIGANTSTPACSIVPPSNIPASNITINIAAGARIWGHGGKGGGIWYDRREYATAGETGGIGMRMRADLQSRVNNAGSVAGGGGGGQASVYYWTSTGSEGPVEWEDYYSSGGGGAPYGQPGEAYGGYGNGRGGAASLTSGGSAGSSYNNTAGVGGGVGQPGGNAGRNGLKNYPAGSAGTHWQWV